MDNGGASTHLYVIYTNDKYIVTFCLKGHSTDFTNQDHFISHKEYS